MPVRLNFQRIIGQRLVSVFSRSQSMEPQCSRHSNDLPTARASTRIVDIPRSGTAALSTGNVTVTNPDTQRATLSNAFTVNQAPAFSTIRIKAGAAYTESTGAVWSAYTYNCRGRSQASTAHAITGA